MDDTTKTNTSDITSELPDAQGELLTAEESVKSAGVDQVAQLQRIETLINLNIAKIDKLKEEIKPVREMMASYLDNDPTYTELSEKAKKASKDKSARKKELMLTENGKQLNDKMEALKNDLSEAQDALSDYLREYQRVTGSNEFEGEDGELRQIISITRLVRKTSMNRD